MSEPQFVPAISKNYLFMLDCPFRRSIISSVAHAAKLDGDYSNKKWIIKYLGTNDYTVIERATGNKYLVSLYHEPGWDYGRFEYSVYKKKGREE